LAGLGAGLAAAKAACGWRLWSTVVTCPAPSARLTRTRRLPVMPCSTGSPATPASWRCWANSRPCTRATTRSPARCSSTRRGRAGMVRGQPARAAAPGGAARALPARVRLPRTAERQAPVRGPGHGGRPRRDRTGPARGRRLLADWWLLAVRHVRGGRLHPRRCQSGRRPSPSGMPVSQRAPRPPGSIPADLARQEL